MRSLDRDQLISEWRDQDRLTVYRTRSEEKEEWEEIFDHILLYIFFKEFRDTISS